MFLRSAFKDICSIVNSASQAAPVLWSDDLYIEKFCNFFQEWGKKELWHSSLPPKSWNWTIFSKNPRWGCCFASCARLQNPVLSAFLQLGALKGSLWHHCVPNITHSTELVQEIKYHQASIFETEGCSLWTIIPSSSMWVGSFIILWGFHAAHLQERNKLVLEKKKKSICVLVLTLSSTFM